MTDEDTTQETEDTEKSIWEVIGMDPPPDDEDNQQYATETEEAEADADKEDKTLRNVMPRVEALEKKMMEDHLQKAKDRYVEQADPIEAKIFAGVAAKVKTPEELKHTIEVVHEQAEALKERIASVEAESKATVERSWGVVNPGRVVQPSEDEEKKRAEAIANGDTVAAFHALVAGDSMLEGRI